jgi:hypothetical protein
MVTRLLRSQFFAPKGRETMSSDCFLVIVSHNLSDEAREYRVQHSPS